MTNRQRENVERAIRDRVPFHWEYEEPITQGFYSLRGRTTIHENGAHRFRRFFKRRYLDEADETHSEAVAMGAVISNTPEDAYRTYRRIALRAND